MARETVANDREKCALKFSDNIKGFKCPALNEVGIGME